MAIHPDEEGLLSLIPPYDGEKLARTETLSHVVPAVHAFAEALDGGAPPETAIMRACAAAASSLKAPRGSFYLTKPVADKLAELLSAKGWKPHVSEMDVSEHTGCRWSIALAR